MRTSPVIRVRPSGGVYILLTVALGVVSVNSGNNLLYLVTALLLGYMAASGIAGRRNVMGAEVWTEMPDEIYAGRAFRVVVKVRNRRRFASLHLIEVLLRSGRGTEVREGPRAFFGLVPPGEVLARSVWMSLPRRGREAVGLELSSAYPFDFFVRWGKEPSEAEVLVFPEPLYRRGEDGSGGEDGEPRGEERGRRFSVETTDVAGIRPYRTGDPMSRIHWKVSARTGTLSTRIFEGPPPPSGRMIDLDALVAAQGVERGLSLAAGRLLESGREGVPLGMKDRGTVIPPASGWGFRLGLLKRLALYEFGRPAGDLR